jgi:hypothetical protein
VAPALMLYLPTGGAASGGAARLTAAEYLFNVPEGFSRLVLEHKIRPGMYIVREVSNARLLGLAVASTCLCCLAQGLA